jgi:hypothetical protein
MAATNAPIAQSHIAGGDGASLDWEGVNARLQQAAEHAALGDRVPQMRRFKGPTRWLARIAAKIVYATAKVLTVRQKAFNVGLLDAVSDLARRVQHLEAEPKAAAGDSAAAAVAAPDASGSPPRSFGAVFEAPVLMLWPERALLYALVYGLRPKRALEIGTCYGGSATIITAAMDDAGVGRLICVDHHPERVTPERWAQIGHRASMVPGESTVVLGDAVKAAGGLFDFALIDGDHTREGVIKDCLATLPVLADSAYVLFHDANNAPVREGVDEIMRTHAECLTECGVLSVASTPDATDPSILWGGLRLAKFTRRR